MKHETLDKANAIVEEANRLNGYLDTILRFRESLPKENKLVEFFCGVYCGGQTGSMRIESNTADAIADLIASEILAKLKSLQKQFEQL